jgi:hypothetical protein
MTITAKYAGRCSVCGGTIGVGEQIEWSKGEAARHEACDRAAAKAARKAARKHARREANVSETREALWARIERHRGYSHPSDCTEPELAELRSMMREYEAEAR